MADRDNFDYFGEGTEGYIQYLQTFTVIPGCSAREVLLWKKWEKGGK